MFGCGLACMAGREANPALPSNQSIQPLKFSARCAVALIAQTSGALTAEGSLISGRGSEKFEGQIDPESRAVLTSCQGCRLQVRSRDLHAQPGFERADIA